MDDLAKRLQADDQTVLKELFEAHYAHVCATIQRFTAARSATEDLAQQVFIRFWQKRHQITINSSPGAYLQRMAINEALAWLRTKKNQQPDPLPAHLPDDDRHLAPDPAEQLLQQELHEQILQAIQSLPPRCQEVFVLSRYEQLSYQEIADKLNISIKTVENQMGKALRLMRERMRGYLR
ncbi:MAG: RNA polymerase sigma-70 factor [Saprospirales bacterium]|nr:RNA polymerase sigma-70 factor [Saprospirales bacterium]